MALNLVEAFDVDEDMADIAETATAPLLLLITNHGAQDTLLEALKENISAISLTQVKIMVSYIMLSGLQLLRPCFDHLQQRKIGVQIILTHQHGISDFDAAKELANFTNIELKVFENSKVTFHSKAWLFLHREKGDRDAAIVGSSNISKSALAEGVEMNVAVRRGADGVGSPIIDSLLKTFNQCFEISTNWLVEDIARMRGMFERARRTNVRSEVSHISNESDYGALSLFHWGALIRQPQQAVIGMDESGKSLQSRFIAAVKCRSISDVRTVLNECKNTAHRGLLLNSTYEWRSERETLYSGSILWYVIDDCINSPGEDKDDARIRLLELLLENGVSPNEIGHETDMHTNEKVKVFPLISLLSEQVYYHVKAWREDKSDPPEAALFEQLVEVLLDLEPKSGSDALDINAAEERFSAKGEFVGRQSALGYVAMKWDQTHESLRKEFSGSRFKKYHDRHEKLKRTILIPMARKLIERGASVTFRSKDNVDPLYMCGLIQEATRSIQNEQQPKKQVLRGSSAPTAVNGRQRSRKRKR